MTNREIAQEISNRIGTAPVPFDSVYSIALQIYNELGGEPTQFDNVYSILLNTLPLVEGGIASKVIDDNVITTVKTWSSSKINSELSGKQNTLTAGNNIDITDNTISAKGYVFDETKGSLAIKYKQDDGDGGQIVSNSATGLGAVAEGYRTQASGEYGSHAEGTDTVASGAAAHAEGNKTTATTNGAHAEGYKTQATGKYSHVEGDYTVASNRDAHAEGWYTNATGRAAHAEGLYTEASGEYSHAEGWGLETLHNLASGGGSHVEGIGTKAINKGAHAEGYGSEQAPNTASGYGSHAEGCLTLAQNQSEHAEGSANVSHKASDNAGNAGNTQHSIGIAFGNNTGTYRKNAVEVMQNGDYYLLGVGGYDGMHIKTENGYENTKTLQDAVNSKQDTLTAGTNIDITNNTISADGYIFDETKGAFATKYLKDEYDGGGIGANNASGNYGSFAEGYGNTASGEYGSHAEGFLNTASGDSAHVEGQENTATHSSAHAEGRKTNATNNGAHSEGTYSDASGLASHAEGYGSTNYHNIASGDGSHAEGICTRSQNKSEHAEGSSNVSHKASNTYGDAGNTQHSIGIGTHYNSTKNAVEVMQNGDYYLLGVGGYQGTDTKVQNASIMTVQEVINSKADAYETATNDDIDFMFAKEIKLIREQKNDKNYIDWLVNTNGETMEYNGQTYYKWVSWANDGNNNSSWTLVEHPNIIVLTNTLDVQLPFNTSSPEFEYWITIDGEGGMGVNNYIKGDYTQKTFQ